MSLAPSPATPTLVVGSNRAARSTMIEMCGYTRTPAELVQACNGFGTGKFRPADSLLRIDCTYISDEPPLCHDHGQNWASVRKNETHSRALPPKKGPIRTFVSREGLVRTFLSQEISTSRQPPRGLGRLGRIIIAVETPRRRLFLISYRHVPGPRPKHPPPIWVEHGKWEIERQVRL